MKGIVFNLLEEAVIQQFGEETWERLLDASKLDGVYTSIGSYPDEHLLRLVEAASAALNLPPNAVVRWFGVSALPLLARKYPTFFEKHQSTRPFLLTLNGIIHPEVRKLYPGADVPDFEFDISSPDVLVMVYRSKRRLCAFAEGLIEGAAVQFGETATIGHPQCLHRGDSACRLEIRFFGRPPQP